MSEFDIDLVNDAAPSPRRTRKNIAPSIAEIAYAERLAVHGGIEDADPATITPGVKTALASIQQSSGEVVASVGMDANLTELREVMVELGLRTDLTADELFRLATEFHSGAMVLAVKAGVAFMAAQESLSESDMSDSVTFKSWIESNGLTKQHVYEAIKLAKAYMAIPADQRKSFISLGKFKAIKLAKLDADQINELVEQNPEALDEFALMSRKELQDEIKRLKSAKINSEAEVETLRGQLRRISEKNHVTNFEFETEATRQETLILQGEVELALAAVQKLFNKVLNDIETPEKQLRIEHVYLAATVCMARASDLIHEMQSYELNLPERVFGQHILTPEESAEWLKNWQVMQSEHAGKEVLRDHARENAKDGKRGRKLGSKNKAE